MKLGFAFLPPKNLPPPPPNTFSPKYPSTRQSTPCMPPQQSTMPGHPNLHKRLDTPLSSSDLLLTTFSPRSSSAVIAKNPPHTRLFDVGTPRPVDYPRTDGYPTPAHPLTLPHLHRRDESDSNAISYSELVVAVSGAITTALDVFKGRKYWKNRRNSKKFSPPPPVMVMAVVVH